MKLGSHRRKGKRQSRKRVAATITKHGGHRKQIEIALRKCVLGKPWRMDQW